MHMIDGTVWKQSYTKIKNEVLYILFIFLCFNTFPTVTKFLFAKYGMKSKLLHFMKKKKFYKTISNLEQKIQIR